MPEEAVRPGSDTAAPATESPGLPAPRGSFVVRYLIVPSLLFALALGASWQIRRLMTHTPPDSSTETAESLNDRGKQPSPLEWLARGDIALNQRRFVEALHHYRELAEKDVADVGVLAYRQGLCWEAVGNFDQAMTAYRRSVAGAPAPVLALVGHLGLARSLLALNRPEEARQLLYPFLFDERKIEKAPQACVVDAHFLFALALAKQQTPVKAGHGLAQDHPLAFDVMPLPFPFYLDEIDGKNADSGKSAEAWEAGPLVVRKKTDAEPALVVSLEQTAESAAALLDQLATSGGLKTQWKGNARKEIENRPLTLYLYHRDLQDVLEQVADYLNLGCEAGDDKVVFSSKNSLDSKSLTALGEGMCQRALLAALRADPNHGLAPAVFLELGNREARQGQWQNAATWYRRLLRDARSSPLTLAAYYNLGLTHWQGHDSVRAKASFFHVIDQTPGHPVALRAEIQVGRLCLEENEFQQAVVHLNRALARGKGSPHHAVATLTLAAAHLQHDSPASVQAILARNLNTLQREPYRATAAFLDSYARYRHVRKAKPSTENRREINDLLASLGHVKDREFLGAYGRWLVGQAYHDLGFWVPAAENFRAALSDARGLFRAPVEFALAESLLMNKERADAEAIYVRLAKTEPSFRTRASFRLAQLNLEDGRHSECAIACQEIWNRKDHADPAAVLRLWGVALERQGELGKAAQCFAGKAPQ